MSSDTWFKSLSCLQVITFSYLWALTWVSWCLKVSQSCGLRCFADKPVLVFIWQHRCLDSKAGTAFVLRFLPTMLVKIKRDRACISEVGDVFLLLLLSCSSCVLLFLIPNYFFEHISSTYSKSNRVSLHYYLNSKLFMDFTLYDITLVNFDCMTSLH